MKNPDKFISFAIAYQIILQGCKNILVQGIPFLFSINNQLNLIIMGSALFLYLKANLQYTERRVPKQATFILLFVIFTYYCTYLFYPQNFEFIKSSILRTIVSSFLTFLFVSKLRTFEYLNLYILKGSYFITICGILYGIVVKLTGHSTTSDWSTYSMSMSNVVLLSVIWQLNKYFESKDVTALAASIIGTVIIFLYGSRNPFLAIGVFIIISIFFKFEEKRNQSRSFIKWILFIFICIIISNFNIILLTVQDVLESLGVSSRMIYYLVNADTEDFSSGRIDIYNKLWNVILDNPLLGFGVSGDKARINELAHNLYLSVFVTYGLFIGLFIIIYILYLTIKGLKKTNGIERSIIIMYACLVFPRSFTGGDIWINDNLWFLLGILISSLYNRKKKNISYECEEINESN